MATAKTSAKTTAKKTTASSAKKTGQTAKKDNCEKARSSKKDFFECKQDTGYSDRKETGRVIPKCGF